MRLTPLSVLVFATLVACTGPKDQDTGEPCTPTTWYADGDGDGYGRTNVPLDSCTQPDGYAPAGEDCADDDAAVHPDAPEVCDRVDNDCDGRVDDADDTVTGVTTTYRDGDGDGHGDPDVATAICTPPSNYVTSSDDCDDDAATVYPGAPEVCDSLDNDCDGAIDDADADVTGQPTWYADVDGDTFGDAAASSISCFAAAGEVADATDCDDASASVYPGAPEVCDDVDDDCDGLVDDADDLVTGAPTWYADVDGDSFGDPSAPADACVAPEGTVADATDCADGDPAVFPGAPEVCDGYDDDCDSLVDLADPALDLTTTIVVYADADGDAAGDDTLPATACSVESGYAAAGDDCDDTSADVYPGAPDRCGDAVDADCDGEVTTCEVASTTGVLLTAEARNDQAGFEVAPAGDFDGDGYPDLLVGARFGHKPQHGQPGTAYVVRGPITAGSALGDAWVTLDGEEDEDHAGSALIGGRDVDGDGLADALVGVPGSSRNGGAGAAVLLYGGAFGHLGLADADVILQGVAAGSEVGVSVDLPGDVTGDGVEDVLVGADEDPTVAPEAGAVYGWSGVPAGVSDVSGATFVLTGVTEGDEAGRAVVSPGDLDGDGVSDLAIGATQAAGGGLVYVYLGPVLGSDTLANADATWMGESASSSAGKRLVAPGDVDGDGVVDLFVGDPQEHALGGDTGAAYLLRGPALSGGTLDTASLVLRGEASGGQAGLGLGSSGDLDGDGRPELLVGAPHDYVSTLDAGAVYVVSGARTGTVPLSQADAILVGGTLNANLGWAVDGIGDIDGDGTMDLAIGAPDREDGTIGGYVAVLLGFGL